MSDENGNFIPGKAKGKAKEEEDDDYLEEALNEVLGVVQAPVGGDAKNGARSRQRSEQKKSEEDQILDDTLDEILGEVTKDERRGTGLNQGLTSQNRRQQHERDRRRYPSNHEREVFENNFDDTEATESGAGMSRHNPAQARQENRNSGIAALNPGKFFKGLNGKLPDESGESGNQLTSLALGADHDEVEAELDEFVRITNSEKRDDPEIQESLRRLCYDNNFRHQRPPGDADRDPEGALNVIGNQEGRDMFGRGQNIAAQRGSIMDPLRMLGQRRRNNPVVVDDNGLGGNHQRNNLNDVLGGQANENYERQTRNKPQPVNHPALAKSMLENAGNAENIPEVGGNVAGNGEALEEENFWKLLKPDSGGPMQMLQNYKALTENERKTPLDLLGELGGGESEGNLPLGGNDDGSDNLAVGKSPLNQLSQAVGMGGGSNPMIPGGMIPAANQLSQLMQMGGGSNPMIPGGMIPAVNQLSQLTQIGGGRNPMIPGGMIPDVNQLSQLTQIGVGSNPMIPGGMMRGKAPGGMHLSGAGAQGQLPGDEIDPDNASFGDMLSQLMGLELMRAENNRCPQSDGMNTVIILDCSASMSGEPFQQAQKFVHNFLSELEVIQFEYGIEENVALITVGEQLSVMQHLTSNYSLVRQQCDCMLTEGPTKLHLALPLPNAVLSQRTLQQHLVRGLSEIHNHIVCPRVILISDGWPTEDVNSEHLASANDQTSYLLQNICIDLLRKTTSDNMITMYCYPVGNANQGFLEMLAESTGGRVLEASDAERLSRHFLHHNLCGPLQKSGINLADRSRVAEEVKKAIVMSDEADVDEVMKILNQPEPDVQSRDEEIMTRLKQSQEDNGKPQEVKGGGQRFLGGMGQLMQGIRGQRPSIMPQMEQPFEGQRGQRPLMQQMGGPVEGQPPKEMLGLEEAWEQINNVFQGQVPQQGGQMQGQPIRAQMGQRQNLFQQGQGIQLPFGSEIGQLPNFMGQQEGRQLNIAELLSQHQIQGQRRQGQGDPLGLRLFGQQGLSFGGQGQPQRLPADGQIDGPSEEDNIIAMLNHYDEHADQRSREESGNLSQDGQQRPALRINRQREDEERQKPREFDGFGSEASVEAILAGLEGGEDERARRREGPRLRRDMNEEDNIVVYARKDNNEDHNCVVGKANDGDLDVMLDECLGLGDSNDGMNPDRGQQMANFPQRRGQNDHMGQRLNIPNLMRNMESSFNRDSFMRRGQEDAVNKASVDRARPNGQGVRGPRQPQDRRGADS